MGSSWNPDADLGYAAKLDVLRDYATRYPCGVFIETGLYGGRGSGMALLDLFRRYIAVDIDPANCDAACEVSPHAEIWQGDSGSELPPILAGVSEPAMFWLDAHVVCEPDDPAGHSPLLAEIAAILAWPHAAQSVVLIDDVRLMGTAGWPTEAQVWDAIGDSWASEIREDIWRLT